MANQIVSVTTTTSGTVTAADTQQDVCVCHDAGVTLTLTVAFPATPIDGQQFIFCSVGGITTLTLSAVNTIASLLTTMAAGGSGTWLYSRASTKWFKIK